jgi:hypothetical protein
LLIILETNIGMMGYENTERTGLMEPAVLMVVKDGDNDGKAKYPEQNESELSATRARQPYH